MAFFNTITQRNIEHPNIKQTVMKHRERRRGHDKGQEEMQCIQKVRWETQQEQIKNNKTREVKLNTRHMR